MNMTFPWRALSTCPIWNVGCSTIDRSSTRSSVNVTFFLAILCLSLTVPLLSPWHLLCKQRGLAIGFSIDDKFTCNFDCDCLTLGCISCHSSLSCHVGKHSLFYCELKSTDNEGVVEGPLSTSDRLDNYVCTQ
ncbi:unnamed protein product [Periconia digitata]|uniref:Uncharacterized protein n=1 Tax=Periconia digitata TaxID=1303443 RepID=A0A9W4XLD3_9PLEO|nr:unnamed protein product [Periconia digitata]